MNEVQLCDIPISKFVVRLNIYIGIEYSITEQVGTMKLKF